MDVVFNQGARENLPSTIAEGNLYFCTNGETFLDINNETRVQLNPPETLATQQKNGLLSKEDKVKIDNLDNLETTKAARFVIGSSAAGYTAQNCDYLCDGIDDQVEINAAIAALPPGEMTSGQIILLDGTYNITSPIIIDKAGVTISGNGKFSNTALMRMWESTSPQGIINFTRESGMLKDLFLYGNNKKYTNTINNHGIYITGATVTIQNVGIGSCSAAAISAVEINNSLIDNVYISSSNIGISITNSFNNTIANNVIDDMTHYAIDLQRGSNNHIVNNIGYNFSTKRGINIISSSENIISNNNLIKTSGYSSDQYSIFVYGADSTNNIISNNLILGKDVTIQGATNNSVYGNKWKKDSAGVITSTTAEPGPTVQLNADLLGGKPASDYVTNATLESKSYVTNEVLANKSYKAKVAFPSTWQQERYTSEATGLAPEPDTGDEVYFSATISDSHILETDTPHITPVFSLSKTIAEQQMELWNYCVKAVSVNGGIKLITFENPSTIIADTELFNLQIEVTR